MHRIVASLFENFITFLTHNHIRLHMYIPNAFLLWALLSSYHQTTSTTAFLMEQMSKRRIAPLFRFSAPHSLFSTSHLTQLDFVLLLCVFTNVSLCLILFFWNDIPINITDQFNHRHKLCFFYHHTEPVGFGIYIWVKNDILLMFSL